MAHEGQTKLIAGEAEQFLKTLRLVVDRRATAWEALHVCPETGEYWVETTEGRYDYTVLIKVTKEYAETKYGPLPTT